MIDNLLMLEILGFLVFLLAFKAQYNSNGNDGFFDMQNSKAMRGFWCLIIILVHIPRAYQNPIQDMIGSFGYIGVTFFFMTSAYGLSLGIHKNRESIKRFWITRLPKLIVPNLATNIVFALMFVLCGISSVGSLININGWIWWLIGCYVAFWTGYYFDWREQNRRLIVCGLVIFFSVLVYCMQHSGMIRTTTWCTEVFGFIWGMILFAQYDIIKNTLQRKWLISAVFACLLSAALGMAYLVFKPVVFWGDYVLKIILGFAILSFVLTLNRRIQIGNRISWFLGDISFEMYLTHISVFRVVEKAFPNVSSGCYIVLSIAVTIVFSMFIHRTCNMLIRKLR